MGWEAILPALGFGVWTAMVYLIAHQRGYGQGWHDGFARAEFIYRTPLVRLSGQLKAARELFESRRDAG